MPAWVERGRRLMRVWIACVLLPGPVLLASWVVRHGHSRWRETSTGTRARATHGREGHTSRWREGHTARGREWHALRW